MNFFKTLTNSKLLLISVVSALLAIPFGKTLGFLENESIFLTLRLVSFVIFMYVVIKVINTKTKSVKK